MGFYSIWPYFIGMLAVLMLAATPLLKWADTPPTTVPVRVHTIDGLRGFLALSVVFHHAAIYHQYLLTGMWGLPPSRFYANLGGVGVSMYFMITGYLFWTQMLKAKGRPNFLRLYVGRVFRIVPLYFLLAAVVLLGVGVLTQWRLNEAPVLFAKNVGKWLAGGFLIGGPVNTYIGTGRIAAYVTWSLHYEWLFYGSLLLTSLLARTVISAALAPALGFLAAAVLLSFDQNNIPVAAIMLFCAGMGVAAAKSALASRSIPAPQWALSIGILACLALALGAIDGAYNALTIALLATAFTLILFGGTVFGLLLTRPARRLGDISYGIYLLQGPILFTLFANPSMRAFAASAAWSHWIVVLAAVLLLVLVATATHALVERPGVLAGQWVLARVASARRRPTAETPLAG